MAMAKSVARDVAVRLKNTTTVTQSCFDTHGEAGEAGVRYDINGGGVRIVQAAEAALFLNQCRGRVVTYEPVETARIPGEEVVWLANNTGNPFGAKTVKLRRIVKGIWEDYDAPNPLREALPLRQVMSGGQRVIKTPDGGDEQTVQNPKIVMELAPFTRQAYSSTYATWWLNRDAQQETHHIHKLIGCREPWDFEPNDSWPLLWLQVYAEYAFPIDAWSGHDELLDLVTKAESSYADEMHVFEARQALWRALFFLVINPAYTLPGEADLRARLRAVEKKRGGSQAA